MAMLPMAGAMAVLPKPADGKLAPLRPVQGTAVGRIEAIRAVAATIVTKADTKVVGITDRTRIDLENTVMEDQNTFTTTAIAFTAPPTTRV